MNTQRPMNYMPGATMMGQPPMQPQVQRPMPATAPAQSAPMTPAPATRPPVQRPMAQRPNPAARQGAYQRAMQNVR